MKATNCCVLCMLAIFGIKPSVHADWDLTSHLLTPRSLYKDEGLTHPGEWNFGNRDWAWVEVVPGSTAYGEAYAESRATGVDASATAVGTASEYWVYKHDGPGVGEVEISKFAEVYGLCGIAQGEARGAVMGHARAIHSFDGSSHETVAVLTQSARATSQSQALQITIPTGMALMNISVGEGKSEDDGGGARNDSFAKCPVTHFTSDARVSANMSVLANKNLFQKPAVIEGTFRGEATVNFVLLTRTQCPR